MVEMKNTLVIAAVGM